MMKLLQAHSLTVSGEFIPESMALNLSERQSTATVTVGPGAPTISVGDWIQDCTDPGSGIVWRVKTVDAQYDTETRTIQLEHLITALKDRIMFGEIKPSTMGGGTTCTARQAVEYILSNQSDWTLGTFSYNLSNPYTFNGDDLLSALETVSSSLDDCWWSYDFSSYPFALNITGRSAVVGTELRLSRNIQTAKHTVDRTRMYTRLYPIGKNNLHIDGNYVSQNENLYGIICKTETDQSKDSKAELRRWAEERIAKHCEPSVTVTVNALDLSDATGESLDVLKLGTVCRMPIPGLQAPIQETITRISWPNKIVEPRRATVTLANAREDVASIVNSLMKSSGSSGRAGAKNAEEDHAWFVDTTDHVAMIAEGIAGEGADQDWSRVAQLLVDGNGIHQRVTRAQDDIVTAYSLIDATEDRIMLAVNNDLDGMHSEISQTAEQIQSLVESELDNFYTQIIQEASQIVIRTGENTKTFKGVTQPTGTEEDPLVDGDVWFETEGEFTWGEAENGTWLEDMSRTWAEAVASKAHRYNGVTGVWEKVMNAQALLQDTQFEALKTHQRMMAGRVDVINGDVHAHYAELKVEADRISSRVEDYYNGLSSSITQTAGQIRSEVNDSVNGLSSSITQTAGQIRAEVNDSVNGLQSSITQTAGQIRAEVSDSVNGLESSITQTAGEIRSEVSSSVNGLSSRITQNANRIALVVDGDGIKAASIAASINQQTGQSAVKISADMIQLDGTTIAQRLAGQDLTIQDLTIYSGSDISVGYDSTIYLGSDVSVYSGGSYRSCDDFIADAEVSGNTLTLTKVDGTTVTFRKAVTDWSYSWSGGQLTVTALPMNNSKAITGVKTTGSWSGNTYNGKVVYWDGTDDDGSTWDTGSTFSVSRATTLTGEWNGNTYKVTATPQGNTNSVSPQIHPVSSQGGAYFDTYIGTYNGSSWTNHGDAKRFTIDDSGLTVYVKDSNSWVYAQKTLSDSNLTAGNIKSGVTIFGTTGSYVGTTSLSGSWSSGVFSVSASPQGATKTTSLSVGSFSWSSGTGTATIYATIDSGATVYNTGKTASVSDSNLTAGNIKNGVTIFGVTGSYGGSGTVSGDDIDLNGSSSSTSSTKPTTAISKGVANFTGYIWHKKSDGTWENLRSFSISTGATHFTTPLYYYANGTYHQVTENRLMYYTT